MQVSKSPSPIKLTLSRALCPTVIQQLTVLSHRLQQVDGVQSVMTQLDSCRYQHVLIHPKEGVELAELLRRMATALRVPVRPSVDQRTDMPPDAMVGAPRPDTSTGCFLTVERRHCSSLFALGGARPIMMQLGEIGYGALAVASLGMAWVGLLVPGIPTVPFVILTVAFAAKSSPALHERLRNARVFGPMILDWERYRGIRRHVRTKAIIVVLILISITLILASPSVGLYAIIGAMSALSVTFMMRIPLIPESEAKELEPQGSTGICAVA
jgi:uncharacterized membrane protein YbaN (DUF454 family)